MAQAFKRREFLRRSIGGLTVATLGVASLHAGDNRTGAGRRKPNLLFILADQWRAQATGYAGNDQVKTPNLDKLAAESVNFTTAVSGCPVCCPYRASLITGRYPLTHGVFLNDVRLNNEAVSIADAYNRSGYETGFIGKWHLDGDRRGAFIPRERRQGFKFWKALGCTHNYNNSVYWADKPVLLKWDGYDAIAQTKEAARYIHEDATGKSFALFLSWGPPHAPYHTAPEKYRSMYKPEDIQLRPNVPAEHRAKAKQCIAGYYAHITALDDCVGQLMKTLDEQGIAEDTIVVFTSDHGDMLFSQGGQKKQQPWDESIMVPFLLRYPRAFGLKGCKLDMPFNTPDIMPTLLGLCDIEPPTTVEGEDFSPVLLGKSEPDNDAALISCPSPFGQWHRGRGGREYRGIRTRRYTYTRDLSGPWLLYDNEKDPYQLENLCNKPEYAELQKTLDAMLNKKLEQTGDKFLPGPELIEKWGIKVNKSGTVPYTFR